MTGFEVGRFLSLFCRYQDDQLFTEVQVNDINAASVGWLWGWGERAWLATVRAWLELLKQTQTM